MSRNAQVDKLVAQMKERLDSNTREKEKEKAHQLAIAPRREIVEAKDHATVDAWCTECRRDYTAPGMKIVEGRSAVYRVQCPDGHDNYRYITDVGNDPYWSRSRKVQADREAHEMDIISPHDPRFKTLYRRQWLEAEARREEYEHARQPTR